MLAGEAPFAGPTAQAVIMRVMTETARSLTAVRATVTPQLAAVITQAMAKSAADRFSTSGEFARALESATTVTGVVPSQPAVASRFPRVLGAGIAAAVLVVVAVLAALAWRHNTASASVRRIAVLPFENAGSADDEYFADGMTDEVRSPAVVDRRTASDRARQQQPIQALEEDAARHRTRARRAVHPDGDGAME
jgi:serine/threonine-protein kinase